MLAFLKQHYEKIVLAVFVLGLAGALFMITNSIRNERSKLEELEQEMQTIDAAGGKVEPSIDEEEWEALATLQSEERFWQSAEGRSEKQKNLFWPGPMIVCENPDCVNVIPADVPKCPFCGEPVAYEPTPEENGENGNGEGTPKPRPGPSPDKLRIMDTSEQYFPIAFENRSGGDLFFEVEGRDGLVYRNVGGAIEVPGSGTSYKIADLEKKTEKEYRESIDGYITVDASEVTIVNQETSESHVLTVEEDPEVIGRTVELIRIDPDATSLRDLPRHNVSQGERFTLERNGKEKTYRVEDIAGYVRELTVTVKNTETGDTTEVERFDREEDIPEEMRSEEESSETRSRSSSER